MGELRDIFQKCSWTSTFTKHYYVDIVLVLRFKKCGAGWALPPEICLSSSVAEPGEWHEPLFLRFNNENGLTVEEGMISLVTTIKQLTVGERISEYQTI